MIAMAARVAGRQAVMAMRTPEEDAVCGLCSCAWQGCRLRCWLRCWLRWLVCGRAGRVWRAVTGGKGDGCT